MMPANVSVIINDFFFFFFFIYSFFLFKFNFNVNIYYCEISVEDSNNFFRSKEIISIPDVRVSNRLTSGKYKAFILFADEDIDFAVQIIQYLEDRQLNVHIHTYTCSGVCLTFHQTILNYLLSIFIIACNRFM